MLLGVGGGRTGKIGQHLAARPAEFVIARALLGGLTGATVAALGWAGVGGPETAPNSTASSQVLPPSFISPVIAMAVAFLGCWLVHRITNSSGPPAQ